MTAFMKTTAILFAFSAFFCGQSSAAEKPSVLLIEQPCLTYVECLAVRRQTPHPFVLDENIDDLAMLLRAKADLAMDVVNLKISKLGGLTKIRQARDLCVSMGIAMTLEDSWGGDIAIRRAGPRVDPADVRAPREGIRGADRGLRVRVRHECEE